MQAEVASSLNSVIESLIPNKLIMVNNNQILNSLKKVGLEKLLPTNFEATKVELLPVFIKDNETEEEAKKRINECLQLYIVKTVEEKSKTYIILLGIKEENMAQIAKDTAVNVLRIIEEKNLKNVIFISDLRKFKADLNLKDIEQSLRVLFSPHISKIIFGIEDISYGNHVLKLFVGLQNIFRNLPQVNVVPKYQKKKVFFTNDKKEIVEHAKS